MSKMPAFQFYPADWRKSADIQAMSFHERGIWFEILCLMHESESRGKLMLSGRPMSDEILSKLLGISRKKLQNSIKILLEFGVAFRDESGALCNRRMIRDEHIRRVRAESGRLGGNPNLLNQPDNQKRKQKTTPSSSSSASAQEDISNDISEPPKPRKPRKSQTTIPEDFEITDKMQEWFKENCPRLDITKELKKFRSRCEAKGTVYKDWVAGWKTQMLNAEEWFKGESPKATTNGYDPKKDIMSPEYEMPSVRSDFSSVADTFFSLPDPTQDTYETMKANWLETSWAQGHEHEITDYERGYKFRQRFGKAGPDSVGTSADAGRG